MGPTLPDPSNYLDLQGTARLRQDAKSGSNQGVRDVARQFEGMMLQMMLKSMRDAVPRSDFLRSSAVDTYEGLYDKQVALQMSKSGGIGIADMIVRQLSRPTTTPPTPGDAVDASAATDNAGLPLTPAATPRSLAQPPRTLTLPGDLASQRTLRMPRNASDGLALRLGWQASTQDPPAHADSSDGGMSSDTTPVDPTSTP